MPVNDATIRLITEFEGFVPNWYPDPAHGWKVPTAMYGHTDAAGQPFYADTKDRKFTKEEGIATLKRDLAQYESAVNRAVKVSLNPNQFGALVSFTYNLGEGNLNKSTLVKKLNAGDYVGASEEFTRWNKAGGKVIEGLKRRREAERQLFLAPVSGPKPEHLPPDAPIIVHDEEPTNGSKSIVWVISGFIVLAIIAAAIFFLVPIG